jgi:ABC-2 type transport system ATP-binding protein
MAEIRIEKLTKHFGDVRAVQNLDLVAEHGSFIALLGPSGCGKTTMMRCVVGVQRIASGEVIVLGQPAGTPALRSRVGYVTQAASVYTDITVRANLRYFAAIYGVSAAEADRALADVDLTAHAGQVVSTLSGGEKTRVSLACALLAGPRLLVLDEPTVGLDPVLRRELWGRFHELTNAGTTLLVSSHVMDEASQCDKLLLMRDGHIVADESPASLRAATGTDDIEEAFLRVVQHATDTRAR